MRLQDISKEYVAANRIILAIIIILLALPFASILAERHNYSPLSSNTLSCFVKTHTGEPCPTCGLTRSILLLYKGHFQESVFQYTYGYLFVLILILQLFFRAIPLLSSGVWIPYVDITQMILCGLLWLFIIY
jgi:hypothetical protein